VFNRQAIIACSFAVCLASAWAATPSQAFQPRIGIDSAVFEWPEAGGNPTHYGVWVSRNGSAFAPFGLVSDNRAEIDLTPGERVAIYVYGMRPHPLGGWEVGPTSEVSETVLALATPQFPNADEGSWLLHCPSCGDSELRDLRNASTISEQFSPPAPWEFATRAEFDDGSIWLVWQNIAQGRLLLSQAYDAQAAPIGPIDTPPEYFMDMINTAPNGGDEFLFIAGQNGNQLDRYVLGNGNQLEWTGSSPGMAGAMLGPVADYTGDGRDDLLWINRAQGLVAVWSFSDFDPVQRRWIFQDSYLLDLTPFPGYDVVDASDYDGDGSVDILWRGAADGDLWVNYLMGGLVEHVAQVPALPGDEQLDVVGSVNMDGAPGEELAMRDRSNGRLWIVYPTVEGFPSREAVLDAGTDWDAVYVGP